MTTNVESLRTLESIHGWLGWASIGALAIPAALLLRKKRVDVRIVVACTAFATIVATLGGYLYAYYTPMLKRAIYVASYRTGLLMERKEHLAVVALALAWCGCLLYVAGDDDDARRTRARIAHVCFVVSAMLAFVIAVLGATVASTRTF
jgi:uncharacterized membrane protein YfcA